uniref:Solute carrier family 15 member 1b n=1 Tax=Callorhinchus milii TaxID=7868 RepID=A0A4W3HGI2_CALMI
VINEFCERFSYYGMRAVLVLYFRYFLRWDEDQATAIYHAFVALCYFTPILGAIIADSWLGKFKTIIYLSIVYAIGQLVMSIGAIADLTDKGIPDGKPDSLTLHVALSATGLLLIALGTGGIKPCVSSFGGDQFEEHQENQRKRFFSIFYLSINAGSLISTIITPVLRSQQCGKIPQECYPLAFGVPAALMVVALIVFILGSPLYKRESPQGNIVVKVSKCVGFAIKNRFVHRSKEYPKREHFLDWAIEKYDEHLIAQIKMVLKVLFLYIPLPMFWALFDQQGSRWTFQATVMDGDFTVNPILILIMVPIFDIVIYPLINKCKINFSPLRKITVGMLIAGLAFVVAALLQIQIDKTLPDFPGHKESQIKILNSGDSVVNVTISGLKNSFTVQPLQVCGSIQSQHHHIYTVSNSMIIIIIYYLFTLNLICSVSRFVNGLTNLVNISMNDVNFETLETLSGTNYSLFTKGKKTIIYTVNGTECKITSIAFGYGSSFTILLNSMCTSDDDGLIYIEDIKANTIHMAWQIPQYFLMTCGEVIFSVTGLEFSYSQAPSNMKAVLQAGWLLTTAFGNIIVLIVAEVSSIEEQWAEYILFASLLGAVSIIFGIMASFYVYVDPAEMEAEFEEKERAKKKAEDLESHSIHENGNETIAQSKF